MKTEMNQISTEVNQTTQMRTYITRKLVEEMGEETYSKIHYLMKDELRDKYYQEHEEELIKMFPKAETL